MASTVRTNDVGRRTLFGIVGAGALASATGTAVARSRRRTVGAGPRVPGDETGPAYTPFSARLPILRPLGLTEAGGRDRARIEVREATAEILPGHRTRVVGYDGLFGSLLIRASRGRPLDLEIANRKDVPTATHLHGGHVPADSDGHPMDAAPPGASRTYHYPNTQRGTTLWFHDHTHEIEAAEVFKGQHGVYVVDDPAEAALGLPSGARDLPLVLRDACFDDDAELVFGDPALRRTPVVNGRARPRATVQRRAYRCRVVNSANERVFRLSLGADEAGNGGVTLTKIGTDGGLLDAPVEVDTVEIASGERVDLVVDFSQFAAGDRVYLDDRTLGSILAVDVVGSPGEAAVVPAVLATLPTLPAATVEREVHLSFDLTGDPVGLVNGRPYDMERADFVVRRGDTESWTIFNDDPPGIDHTFHTHLEQFEVVSRNGGPPTEADRGLKDTINLESGEQVRIRVRYTEYLGMYLFHCHYLEHSSIGMMAQMLVVDEDSTAADGS